MPTQFLGHSPLPRVDLRTVQSHSPGGYSRSLRDTWSAERESLNHHNRSSIDRGEASAERLGRARCCVGAASCPLRSTGIVPVWSKVTLAVAATTSSRQRRFRNGVVDLHYRVSV